KPGAVHIATLDTLRNRFKSTIAYRYSTQDQNLRQRQPTCGKRIERQRQNTPARHTSVNKTIGTLVLCFINEIVYCMRMILYNFGTTAFS
ncbi:hypothetical protein, partial [Pseudomonas savastanoi]|uniref:hypothetical protein n=1 Tax=Pseudomonas savastanoi TaxID=29438 RepID=UPI001C824813